MSGAETSKDLPEVREPLCGEIILQEDKPIHIENDGRVISKSGGEKHTSRFHATGFLAIGLLAVGIIAIASCTYGLVKHPVAAAENAVGFSGKKECKVGDPCHMPTEDSKVKAMKAKDGKGKKGKGDDDKKDDKEQEKGKEKDQHKGKDKDKDSQDKEHGKDESNKCGATWGGCLDSKCCADAGMQCYAKDEYWAVCKGICTKGVDPDTHESWSCNEVGKRDWIAAMPPNAHKNGFPSLFCFTFVRSKGQEVQLLKNLVKSGLGIFACEEFLVLADRKMSLGHLPKGRVKDPIQTVKIPDSKATGMTLFESIWKAIRKDGKFQNHDWTVKVNPDTVLLPGRLRVHLKPKTYSGASQYVRNCKNEKSVVNVRKLEEKENDNKGEKDDRKKNEDKDEKEDKKTKDDKDEKEDKKKKDDKDDKKHKKNEGKDDKKDEKTKDDKDEKEDKKKKDDEDDKKHKKNEGKDDKKDEKTKEDKDGKEDKVKGDKDEKNGRDKDNEKDKKDKKDQKHENDKKSKEEEDEDEEVEKKKNPIMMGALELFSVDTVKLYLENGDDCKAGLKNKNMSANIYMQSCMDFLAVSKVDLYDLLQDAECGDASCANPWAAAFHNDFNTAGSWIKCWKQAIHGAA